MPPASAVRDIRSVSPHALPSPSNCLNRGKSCGVEMRHNSRMRPSMSVVSGNTPSACHTPAGAVFARDKRERKQPRPGHRRDDSFHRPNSVKNFRKNESRSLGRARSDMPSERRPSGPAFWQTTVRFVPGRRPALPRPAARCGQIALSTDFTALPPDRNVGNNW